MLKALRSILFGAIMGLSIPSLALGQATLMPDANQRYFNDAGQTVSNGKVFYYIPNTTTPKTVWQDSGETTPQTNPVLLDAGGKPQPGGQTFGSGCYQQQVVDQNGIQIWSAVTCSTGSSSGGSTASTQGVMVGTVVPWMNTTLPPLYLETGGQAVSRVTYAQLMTAITSTVSIVCQTGVASISVPTSVSDIMPIGAPIEATCFAPGTVVFSKSSGILVLSTNATATTSINATLFPWGNGDGATTFNVPDLRGRVLAGRDNMNSSIAGTLTSSFYLTPGGTGVNPDAMGAVAGSQSSILTTANVPPVQSANASQTITVCPGGTLPCTNQMVYSTGTPGGSTQVANAGTGALWAATDGANWNYTTTMAGVNDIVVNSQGTNSTAFTRIPPTVTSDFIIKALPDTLPTGPGVTSIGGMTGVIACGTNVICNANTISVTSTVSTASITNNLLANMAADTTKCNNTSSSASPVDCTVAQFKTMQSIVTAVTDPLYGADPTGVNDSTTAFQSAWNAACGAGFGELFVPAGTYNVTKINGTACNNIIIQGVGNQSIIKINGDDVNGNWWDLSGSNNITFRDLKFIDNGSAVRIAFLWACTGTSCGTSGVIGGLRFEGVSASMKVTLAEIYAYGFGVLNQPSFSTPSGAFSMRDGTWINTNNNGSLNGAETRTAVIDLTAYNAGSVRSVYQTLTTSTAIANQAVITNVNFIDAATTGTTLSNNAAMVTDGVNQFTMVGGSLQCLCIADFIGWTSDEGLTFTQTAFEQPNGTTACSTTNWFEFGGGVNSVIGMYEPFLSCLGTGGAYIALDQGTGASAGGIWFLTVYGNDVGLNTNNDPFIGKTAAGCGSFTATNNWIIGSNINMIAGANNIVTCGGIDNSTIIQLPGTITTPGATSVDASLHVPSSRFEWVNWTPGGTTITANSPGVSSITRSSAGVYSIVFSPAWANTHYVCNYTVIDTGAVTWSAVGNVAQTLTSAAINIRVASTAVLTDPTTAIGAQCTGTR